MEASIIWTAVSWAAETASIMRFHPGLPPAHETIVASGIGAECCGQITPGCAGSQDPENAIEDTTVVYPRNTTRFVGQHRLDGQPFIIGEFIAHDSSP
jgi:hypothetical protein